MAASYEAQQQREAATRIVRKLALGWYGAKLHDANIEAPMFDLDTGKALWGDVPDVDVANRQELTTILNQRTGVYSLYQEIAKAATAGFQLGGIVPHGYFTPDFKHSKVVFVPTREGYAFCAAHGPGAVLRNEPALIHFHERLRAALAG